MERLKAWHDEKRKELTVKVTAVVETTTIASQPTPRQRNTATSRQLDALPSERTNQVEAGNATGLLTAKWSCKSKACRGYSGLCFYAARDDPSFHLPIYPRALTAWAEAIIDGKLTVDEPSSLIQQQMQMQKDRNEGSKKGRQIER